MFGEKLEGEKLSSPTECFEDRFARRTVKSMRDCVSIPIASSTSPSGHCTSVYSFSGL